MLGYAHIPKLHAELVIEFNKNYLTPYINYHRPCFYPEVAVYAIRLREKRSTVENMMTPYEKLKSLPGWEQYLKEGTTPHALESKAESMSDNEAAEQLQSARESLFKTNFERKA